MAPGSTFTKVFKRRINKAAVKTDKAEKKLLDDAQYTPPPGHIGFIKGLMSNADGSQGAAKFVSIGGSRMEEVREARSNVVSDRVWEIFTTID